MMQFISHYLYVYIIKVDEDRNKIPIEMIVDYTRSREPRIINTKESPQTEDIDCPLTPRY